MYVKIDKKKEDTGNVWYTFYSKISGEEYINEKGIPRFHLVEVRGIGVFNKTTETFSIDWDKTDDYFKDQFSMLAMIRHKIVKSCKDGDFPDMIDLATG